MLLAPQVTQDDGSLDLNCSPNLAVFKVSRGHWLAATHKRCPSWRHELFTKVSIFSSVSRKHWPAAAHTWCPSWGQNPGPKGSASMPLASILHLCCLRRCSASTGSLHLRETGISWLTHKNRHAAEPALCIRTPCCSWVLHPASGGRQRQDTAAWQACTASQAAQACQAADAVLSKISQQMQCCSSNDSTQA